jgi:drug/metabolite transporter (DMT)-like permease
VSAAAVLLALASSAAWGTADFTGGLVSRRLPAVSVSIVSQAAGFVLLLLIFAGRGGGLDTGSFGIGLLAGIGGGLGLATFYRALALGTMSIVSPLVACGAVVPFTISIATGERPATIAAVGAVVALAGAVLASVEERRAVASGRSRAIVLAALAALALGLFVYFLGLGSREGDALSTLVGARVGSLVCLACLGLALREPLKVPRPSLPVVAAIGLCDVSANALFALASSRGLLSLVSVLGSLYPIVTVLLAYTFLHERVTRVQLAGIAIALAGIVAVSAG